MVLRPMDTDMTTSPRTGLCAHTPSRNQHMLRNRTTSPQGPATPATLGSTTSFCSGFPEFFEGGTRCRRFFYCAAADDSDGVTTGSTFRPPSLTDCTHWPPSPVESSAETSRRIYDRSWNGGMARDASSRLARTPYPTTDLIFRATQIYI
jgi:hypothetical protein